MKDKNELRKKKRKGREGDDWMKVVTKKIK